MATMAKVGTEPPVPRPPGALRRLVRRHPWWVDSIVAAIYLVPTLLLTQALFYSSVDTLAPWVVVVLLVFTVIIGAAVLFRRHRPLTVLVIVTAFSVLAMCFGGALDGFPIALAVYAVAVFVSTRMAWISFAATVSVGVATTFLIDAISRAAPDYSTLQNLPVGGSLFYTVFVLIAVLTGTSIGERRRYVTALIDRAADLARERDQQAQLATAAERARITRELHDIVAHSLSVMVTLADGADALAQKDPSRSAAAVREIGGVGRRSLAEMRRLLGVLSARDPEAPLSPQPDVEGLVDLMATYRTAGLPVALEIEGTPSDSAGVQATVYRIIQEALTNALRYATDPTTVVVRAAFDESGATVTVTDDGRLAGEPASPSGTGSGTGSGRRLIGMRERASLYGGTVDAGPGPEGGWSVHVTLPEGGGA